MEYKTFKPTAPSAEPAKITSFKGYQLIFWYTEQQCFHFYNT